VSRLAYGWSLFALNSGLEPDGKAIMGTHVTIDDDVVRAAEKLAREQDRTVGEVISDLARRALPAEPEIDYPEGFPLLPKRPGVVVTLDFVNALRDEEP
jgi:hypothetical protein